MSDSAGCSQLPSLGLTARLLVDRLASDFESRHRSVDSAETDNYSLVIGVFRMANWRKTASAAFPDRTGSPSRTCPLTLLGRAADEQLMPESESSSQKKESPQRLRRCGLLDWLLELYGFANFWGESHTASHQEPQCL